MSTRISTKQKLLSQLESIDLTLKDILLVLTKRSPSINLEPLVELLLEREAKFKLLLDEVEKQHELQRKIDVLKMDCAKSDKQIQTCQLQLKKSEVLLSTALYYSRQKLDSMTKAVKNPVDIEELIRFSHRISAAHGVSAPDNWAQGDPRRPYPNREEIRRGYLGHLDDSGSFRSSIWDALSETLAAASLSTSSQNATLCSIPTGSTGSATPVPPSHGPSPAIPSSMDVLSISRSPNMMLPGVNMVSSPLSIPQSTTNPWSANTIPNPSEPVGNRPAVSSLSAMLESHSRTPHPPVIRFPGDALTTSTSPQQFQRNFSGQSRTPGSSQRPNFSVSMAAMPSSQNMYGDSGQSPRSNLVQTKRTKRRVDEAELMSSDTGSDSSTDD